MATSLKQHIAVLDGLLVQHGPRSHIGALQDGTQGLGLLNDSSREGLLKAKEVISQLQSLFPDMLGGEALSSLLGDLEANSCCPTNKDLLELSLWRRVCHIRDSLSSLDDPRQKPEPKAHGFTKPATSKTFRDFFLEEATDLFATELQSIRDFEEGFDENKMAMMVDSLESGAGLFDDVEKSLLLQRSGTGSSGGKGACKSGSRVEIGEALATSTKKKRKQIAIG